MRRVGRRYKRVGKRIQGKCRYRDRVGAVEEIGHRTGNRDLVAGHEAMRKRSRCRGRGAVGRQRGHAEGLIGTQQRSRDGGIAQRERRVGKEAPRRAGSRAGIDVAHLAYGIGARISDPYAFGCAALLDEVAVRRVLVLADIGAGICAERRPAERPETLRAGRNGVCVVCRGPEARCAVGDEAGVEVHRLSEVLVHELQCAGGRIDAELVLLEVAEPARAGERVRTEHADVNLVQVGAAHVDRHGQRRRREHAVHGLHFREDLREGRLDLAEVAGGEVFPVAHRRHALEKRGLRRTAWLVGRAGIHAGRAVRADVDRVGRDVPVDAAEVLA